MIQSKWIFSVVALMMPAALISASSGSRSRAQPPIYKFDEVCPDDASKKELNLGNGMAVFTFNEADPITREKLRTKGLDCHLELETITDYRFHVYIDEVSLPTLEGSAGSRCSDYFQFGRDIAIFTDYVSKPFCGSAGRVPPGSNIGGGSIVGSVPPRSRLYVEPKDREMDIWLKVRPSPNNNQPDWKPRNLTLTVTVFKTSCSGDPNFRPCSIPLSNCIRQDLFCNGYNNCAWPKGDRVVDETNCERNVDGSLSATSTNGGIFNTVNVPVIIIVVIIILAICVIFFIACSRFIGMVKKPAEPARPPAQSSNQRIPLEPLMGTRSGAPSEPTSSRNPFLASEEFCEAETDVVPVMRMPSLPPSYDEVIKSGSTHPPINRHYPSTDPPPYSQTTDI